MDRRTVCQEDTLVVTAETNLRGSERSGLGLLSLLCGDVDAYVNISEFARDNFFSVQNGE